MKLSDLGVPYCFARSSNVTRPSSRFEITQWFLVRPNRVSGCLVILGVIQ